MTQYQVLQRVPSFPLQGIFVRSAKQPLINDFQARSRRRLPPCGTLEKSLNALYTLTLYVYLDLSACPQEGTKFFPNSVELLSEVLPLIPQGLTKWLPKLLRVTNKKYLFLCFQFSDLRSPSLMNNHSNFTVFLEHLDLNTQELDPLARIIWDYTDGEPFYVSCILFEWTKRYEIYPEWRDLSVEYLVKKVETISMIASLFVSLETVEPRIVAVFSTMLLASVLEILLRTHGTHSAHHVLDIANHFGLYYISRENRDCIKLVHPSCHLSFVSTISSSDSFMSRGLKFELFFSLVLYLKLCLCSRMGEMRHFKRLL
eukprot:jgi/Galph1/5464/GphlegSOOS_G4097.1